MSKWDKISLYKFQQIDAVNKREDLSDLEKACFGTCTIFDMTEYELDSLYLTDAKRCNKLLNKTAAIFSTPFNPSPCKRIGKYFIKYDPAVMSLGQYVELSYFLQSHIKNAHYVLASISNRLWRKNNADDHREKAEYFLHQPVTKVMGSMGHFIQEFVKFNAGYKGLFGLDPETAGDVQSDRFNKNYGWLYSASLVAEHERISLEQAMGLPARQALSDLMYLKALGIYQAEQLKRKR